MEESNLVNLVTSLTGLGVGLLIAAMSLWWNYKTRTSVHREFLYQKQFETYGEMVDAMFRYTWLVGTSGVSYQTFN